MSSARIAKKGGARSPAKPKRAVASATVKASVSPETDEVSARILDAAFEQFCLVGIRRSSMDDVARRADVSRVTVYRKFENHEKLVAALLRRETRTAIAKVEAAVFAVDPDDIEERLVEGFVTGMRAIRGHPLIVALIAKEPDRALPMLTTHASGGLAMACASMAHEIRRAHKKLGVRNGDPEQVAEILARLTHSLVLTTPSGLPLDDDKRIREFARRHIVPMVTGRPSERR